MNLAAQATLRNARRMASERKDNLELQAQALEMKYGNVSEAAMEQDPHARNAVVGAEVLRLAASHFEVLLEKLDGLIDQNCKSP